jgi:GT2 family glycosyltransferase
MNSQLSRSSGRCSITAVVVLYRRTPPESQALSTLIGFLKANPDFAEHLSLVIYDNSPNRQDHEISTDIPVHYHHDPANGGLTAAYNYALARAEQANKEWLLLLDQDTSPTYEFFQELIACTKALQAQQDVAAIVPKLLVQGKIHSPQMHFLDKLRRPFSRSDPISDRRVSGLQRRRLVAYNSGATLRVTTLRAIGGFPNEFWLDYLDHAVFHALCASGYSVYVMDTVLEHDCSLGDTNTLPLWRYRNTLTAETLFVKRTGNFADRLLYRLYLLRSSRVLWASCADRRMWKVAALHAMRLGVSKDPIISS